MKIKQTKTLIEICLEKKGQAEAVAFVDESLRTEEKILANGERVENLKPNTRDGYCFGDQVIAGYIQMRKVLVKKLVEVSKFDERMRVLYKNNSHYSQQLNRAIGAAN
mgnify:CR=1 FL=1